MNPSQITWFLSIINISEVFLEPRGTPVVIIQLSFKAGITMRGLIFHSQQAEPEIPRVPVGRPVV